MHYMKSFLFNMKALEAIAKGGPNNFMKIKSAWFS